jgi:hypothetical protein
VTLESAPVHNEADGINHFYGAIRGLSVEIFRSPAWPCELAANSGRRQRIAVFQR